MEGRGAGGADSPAPSPAPDAEAPVRRRRHRPLYRRLFHYVRTAWTGVKFALGMLLFLTFNNINSLLIDFWKSSAKPEQKITDVADIGLGLICT